jgi:hypothetical protein
MVAVKLHGVLSHDRYCKAVWPAKDEFEICCRPEACLQKGTHRPRKFKHPPGGQGPFSLDQIGQQTRSTVCGQLSIGSRRATTEEHLHLLQRDFSVLVGIDRLEDFGMGRLEFLKR